MDKKKLLIIGGSAAGTALVALAVGSIVLANTPSALILRATANTISDARKIEAFSVAEDVANGGSIAVSARVRRYQSKIQRQAIRCQGLWRKYKHTRSLPQPRSL